MGALPSIPNASGRQLDGANGSSHLGRQLRRHLLDLMCTAGMSRRLMQHLFLSISTRLEVAIHAHVTAAEFLRHTVLLFRSSRVELATDVCATERRPSTLDGAVCA